MTHQHSKEENYNNLYLLVGSAAGLVTGTFFQDLIWIPVLAVFGFLFSAFFLKVLVEGDENA